MARIFLAPSTQEYNEYYSGGSEEYHMNRPLPINLLHISHKAIYAIWNNRKEMLSLLWHAPSGYAMTISIIASYISEGWRAPCRGGYLLLPTSVRDQAAQIIEENLKRFTLHQLVNIIQYILLWAQKVESPAVLVEVAYHDNYDDASWITQLLMKLLEAANSGNGILNVPLLRCRQIWGGNGKAHNWLNIRSVQAQFRNNRLGNTVTEFPTTLPDGTE